MMDKKNLLIIGFRESAKTFWANVRFIHSIAYKHNSFALWYCYDKTKASDRLYQVVLQLQTNKKLIEDFGQLFPPMGKKDDEVQKKSVSEFITTNGVKCKAMSIGESPRWQLYMSKDGTYRPDLVVLDDIDVDKSVKNIEIIDSNYHWISGELLWGLSDHAKIIFLGNIIRNDGIVLRFEKDYKDSVYWTIRRKALIENGEITWPERYSEADVEAKKEKLRSISFNQNMLLIPYAEGDTIIKQSSIRYTKEYPQGSRIVFGIDPAFSMKTNSDIMCLTVAAHKWPQRFIVKTFYFEGREKDEEKFVTACHEAYKQLSCSCINIEANNGGEIIARMLQKKNMAINVIKANKDKITRLREWEWWFERGDIFFLPWTERLVQNLLAFPNVSHDDDVDSMVYSLGNTKDVFLWSF
jgi:predicted phage terminase large subunit-like protein